MKSPKYYSLFLISIVVFIVAILTDNYILNQGISDRDIGRFSKTLFQKQNEVEQMSQNIEAILQDIDPDSTRSIFPLLDEYNELFEDNEYAIVVSSNRGFRRGRAVFWSDHVVGFTRELLHENDGLIHLPNGWFLHKAKDVGDFTIHGLVLVKTDYSYNNNYVKNHFARKLNMPDYFEIEAGRSQSGFEIYDQQNQYLFTLVPTGNLHCTYNDLIVASLLFLLGLALFLLATFRFLVAAKLKVMVKWLIAVVVIVGLYSLINVFNFPGSLHHLKLFGSDYFAYNVFWSSLGDFLVFSGFVFFLAAIFLKTFRLGRELRKSKWGMLVVAILLIGLNYLFFIFILRFIRILVENSTISYAIYRVDDISVPSFIGFTSIALLYLSFALIAVKISQQFRPLITRRQYITILLLISIGIGLTIQIWFGDNMIERTLYYMIIAFFSFIITEKHFNQRRIYVIVLSVMLFTLLSLRFLTSFIESKDLEVQQLHAINMSEEHDPIAEMHLKEVDSKLKQDTLIEKMLIPPYNIAESFIKKNYFEGYLRDYDLQVTFCHKDDSLLIQPENELVQCLPFFDEMIHENGVRIPGTRFFFIDNMNGRITYLAEYKYTQETEHDGHRLFLELNSRILSEGTGFPELLHDKTTFRSMNNQNFSYAKYNFGRLIDRGGKYQFSMTQDAYEIDDVEIQFKKWDNYIHCIYKPDNDSAIILSKPALSVFDYLVSFPYIFVFLFLFAILAMVILQDSVKLGLRKETLGNRIQVSIIAIVFFSVLFIGGGMVIYNVNQYQQQYKDDLVDKIRSISIELDLSVGDLMDLHPGISNVLTYELIRISEIFRTDVNLFGLNGHLITTSRPEIYNKGLISRQMDNTAYNNLRFQRPTRLVHREHIGSMKYFSAYEPLINSAGNTIGYLNVPYFTKENEFRHQIATFIFAFINIYVFILLASILVAIFVSNRITDPLNMVRERLRGIQLGKRSGLIEYQGSDEIGLLVKEYNSKVEELAESAERLAKSERESAWREMAKQIAHEIKNPLTPMKLNIQFLQKTDMDSKEDFQKHLKRITNTLIEQIDNLSTIATEFSNFANIPKAQNDIVDVRDKLQNIIHLFEKNKNCKFVTKIENENPILIYVDKEQLSRALINLVKNAIQAVPTGKKAEIEMKAKADNDWVTIKVSDNGVGISDELKETIFVPNFTTKSSGTGLGLAITKNIIDNFNGEIWFKSEVGKGTSFFIKIPIHKTEKA